MSICEDEKYGTNTKNLEVEGEESLNPENSQTDYTTEDIKVQPYQYSIYELKRKYDRTALHKKSNDEYTLSDLEILSKLKGKKFSQLEPTLTI